MSEAAIVLWILSIVTFTFNVAIICNTLEEIAKMKYGFQDPEEEIAKDLEAHEMGIIRMKNTQLMCNKCVRSTQNDRN